MPAVEFTVNGQPVVLHEPLSARLLDVLRETLHLRATRLGCGEGECGACHVLVDGRALAACNTPLAAVAGCEVVTVEGLADDAIGVRLQRAFIAEQAAQCGYCTSGLLIGATALLRREPAAGEAAVRAGLDGHLCRCGAHPRIVRAVVRVAAESLSA